MAALLGSLVLGLLLRSGLAVPPLTRRWITPTGDDPAPIIHDSDLNGVTFTSPTCAGQSLRL